MKPDDKLDFIIKHNNKMWYCNVVETEGNYLLLLNVMEAATLQLNVNEQWVQLSGSRLPEDLINEVGLRIESSYREALFIGN